ncbi:MAG: hypothetical protein N2248_07040 [candidate division WOR-3 bacterium]|uniref:Glutamine amidotransferase type-2 domain-containing protein n=1 Tax=candidate division WOR-3 bacterium TaxID=2052148 RepID=A0A7C1SD66_UNCW3|nr:hypothetical protein [candidate division WOR-3 bacterium]
MSRFFAAAGRFKMEWLLAAAFGDGARLIEDRQLSGEWGLGYCHGNRLELVRSPGRKTEPGLLKALLELKTDMAVIYQHELLPESTPAGRIPPYIRYEQGRHWMFCHAGRVTRAEALFGSWQRSSGGLTTGELLFAYVFDRFNPEQPQESLNGLLAQLAGEPELSFCLMSADVLAFVCRTDDRGDNPARLWLGRGELIRVICSGRVINLPGISWEPIPSEQVIFIRRQRWAVV